MKNALILLAGGLGERLGLKEPKQFIKIGNTNIIDYFLSNLDKNFFDIIVIAIKNKDKKKYFSHNNEVLLNYKIIFSLAGKTRQISSKNALQVLKKYNPKKVLIHDSARPLVTNELISKIIKKLEKNKSCIPFLSHHDFMKFKKNKNIKINNKDVMSIQTPQGFQYKDIYNAYKHSNNNNNAKDDSSILEDRGYKLKMIPGEITNIKITSKKDLDYFQKLRIRDYKSGIGYDIHKIDFNKKKKLTLCGIKIEHPPLIGHSDADVGFHAICDCILGSLSLNDIGYYFNNKNIKWKNANSKIFMKFCSNKLIEKGYKIVNLDINFICESPNIRKLSPLMKIKISKLLNIPLKKISIKATTNEKIGFIGRGEAIAAEAIIQIVNV